MKESRVTVRGQVVVVELAGMWARCTKCRQFMGMGQFGMRETPRGVLRRQPQCVNCRGHR